MSRSRNFSRNDYLDDAWDDYAERSERKQRGQDRRRERNTKQFAWDEV